MQPTKPPAPRVIAVDNSDGEHPRLIRLDERAIVHVSGISPELSTDPVTFMAACSAEFAKAGEGTAIVHRMPLSLFDDGDDARQLAEFAETVKLAGWRAGAGIELGSGWITWTRENSPAVHMGIRRMMAGEDSSSLVQAGDTWEDIVERLSRYGVLVGAAWRATSGVSGLAALRRSWDEPIVIRKPGQPAKIVRRKQPRWIWNHPDFAGGGVLTGAGDIIWRRPLNTRERENGTDVCPFDVRAMYLAAAAGARLGWSEPTHTGADAQWDSHSSGFYRVNLRRWRALHEDPAGPPIMPTTRIDSHGCAWVTAPILAYVSELGLPLPEIVDSWTCTGMTSTTYLTRWAERIRDALAPAMTAGDERLRKSIKHTYQHAVGMMARPGGRVYRRDWAATIIDEARVRMHRKLTRVHAELGVWPVEVKTDCAYYVVHDELDVSALSETLDVGKAIGKFALDPADVLTVAQYVTGERSRRTSRAVRAANRFRPESAR